MKRPTPELLRELIDYDPETGIMKWKARQEYHFRASALSAADICRRWNNRHAGQEITCVDERGYIKASILDKQYRAHRIIWAMMTGEWPVHEVDHRDGVRLNNRWRNLRAATHAQNAANRGSNRNSTSKHVGVSFQTASGKWRAQIEIDGRNKHIGYFSDEEAAAEAYRDAANRARGEWSRFEASA